MVALNTAYAAPKNAADPQNRVGDFFYEDRASVGKNCWASRLNTQEKYSYHYETASGRSNWPNRDPIEEQGGLNLYAMVQNNPIDYWDYLGMETCDEEIKFDPVIENVSGLNIRLTWPTQPDIPPPVGVVDINFLIAATVKGHAQCTKIDSCCKEENKKTPSVSVRVSGIGFTISVTAGPGAGWLQAIKLARSIIQGANYLANANEVVAAFSAKAALDKACERAF